MVEEDEDLKAWKKNSKEEVVADVTGAKAVDVATEKDELPVVDVMMEILERTVQRVQEQILTISLKDHLQEKLAVQAFIKKENLKQSASNQFFFYRFF